MNLASERILSATEGKKLRVFLFYPLISVVILSYLAVCDKNNGLVINYNAAFTFILHQQRSEDEVSYYSMLQTGQDTQKTLYCRVPHFIITGKHTQGFFMILDYSFLRTTDIAQILKKHRRV